MELFEVGGCVRDNILGKPSNDIDFSVVLDDSDLPAFGTAVSVNPFEIMEQNLRDLGFELFEEARKPEHLTARGKFPRSHPEFPNKAADFVLARKEGTYSDGRRPDSVEVGTLEDDLARRDFRMNAIAKASDGTLIDPFNGVQDINEQVIRAVGKAFDRLTEDALRAVRALRFSATLGFRIDHELQFAMESEVVLNLIRTKISGDRIGNGRTGELDKMFKQAGTIKSLKALNEFPLLTEAMFDGRVRLTPTMKER